MNSDPLAAITNAMRTGASLDTVTGSVSAVCSELRELRKRAALLGRVCDFFRFEANSDGGIVAHIEAHR